MRVRWDAIQQVIKWTVYTLLLVNFALYIRDDWTAAQFSVPEGATLVRQAQAYATTIDELGWFVLLFLFELETYVLSDEVFRGWVKWTVQGTRLVCYVFLGHTIYAYGNNLLDLNQAELMANVTDLCQLAGAGVSFLTNLDYTLIDASNCARLGSGTEWYRLVQGDVVTDRVGLAGEWRLAWVDLVEASTWLAIMFVLEFSVRIQERGIATGALIAGSNAVKVALYGILFLAAGYWAFKGHWLFTWDELLWIGGFAAIEMNVAEWREEIRTGLGSSAA